MVEKIAFEFEYKVNHAVEEMKKGNL